MTRTPAQEIHFQAHSHRLAMIYKARVAAGELPPNPKLGVFTGRLLAKGPPMIPLAPRGGGRRARWRRPQRRS